MRAVMFVVDLIFILAVNGIAYLIYDAGKKAKGVNKKK